MKIRLGYVSICTSIHHQISFKTINYTNFSKCNDINILKDIINHNLNTLYEILKFNIKNNIHFYRITSDLIPLVTHPTINYKYINNHKGELIKLKNIIKNSNMRCDMHLTEYAVLNTTRSEVLSSTISILEYHKNILSELNINYPSIILHIGSNTFGKDNSIKRFINNFNKLDNDTQKLIMIENDDKIFNVNDVLKICNTLNIPFVLDYHHFICNNDGENINKHIKEIFNTWKDTNVNPKIHFSSPKSKLKKEFRTHHDYIDSDEFIKFLEQIKFTNTDIDIMIEAKKKDDALFKLIRELKYKTSYKFIDDTTFLI